MIGTPAVPIERAARALRVARQRKAWLLGCPEIMALRAEQRDERANGRPERLDAPNARFDGRRLVESRGRIYLHHPGARAVGMRHV